MSPGRPTIPNHALAALGAVPILIWWLGWYPGFASSDTIDQFTQIREGVFYNHHPPVHTLYLDILSGGGVRPGLVALFQLIVFGGLLVYAARWLKAAGVPQWIAVGIALLLGISPAIAPTTLALWKDIPFTLLVIWAWVELLALAVEPGRTKRVLPLIRLGLILAGVWLFRGNGPITVIPVLLVLGWRSRHRLTSPLIVAGTLLVSVFAIVGPLYAALDVKGSGIEPAQVFLPDVAASFNTNPDSFTPEEKDLLGDLAPLSIWANRYDCYDSTPLLFDPAFDHSAVIQDPSEYLSLEIAVLLRDPGSVLGHRLCAANFIYSPVQPPDAYFHRPPYDIPVNDVGLRRDPISVEAFEITDRIWRWAEPNSRLWLTWRPAILLIPAVLLIAMFLVVKPGRRFLLPSALLISHLLNVAATSPVQEFRYAYPLYVLAALTLTLAWPTGRSIKSG